MEIDLVGYNNIRNMFTNVSKERRACIFRVKIKTKQKKNNNQSARR
jgi:hypothetical protein